MRQADSNNAFRLAVGQVIQNLEKLKEGERYLTLVTRLTELEAEVCRTQIMTACRPLIDQIKKSIVYPVKPPNQERINPPKGFTKWL